jgi:hypothetical protein
MAAVMPLEKKIERIIVAPSGAEFEIVRSDAFRRASRKTRVRVYSMREAGGERAADPAAAGASALVAGYDVLIDVVDADAAFWAVASAVERGELTLDRLDAAVARYLLTLREAGTVLTPRD